ncbi:AAA family ATPase [Actinoplanes sp. NPDC023714]|uniref:helix-turn-helix transcriptional regulator n=1 Tax=Actinoplanes sp. NPDC023714 TaxID=3154322 RepID=UPI003409FE8C
MIGRDRYRERVSALLDAAEHGRGGALVVRGSAGVGKTTLLEDGRETALRRGFTVLSCAGIQSETRLGLAGLHQLLRVAVDRATALPDRQRDALLSVFGIGAEQSPDRLLVSIAVLGLVEELAREKPILITGDDLQWLDDQTAAILGFVARRITNSRIAMLLTVRDGDGDTAAPQDLPDLVLPVLTDRDAAALLDDVRPELDREMRARVLREADGNPLALVELSRGVLERGTHPAGERLPLPVRMERVFAAQVSTLPAPARDLLLLAAVSTSPALGELERAGAVLQAPLTALTAAEEAGLVFTAGGELRFRHPLVRSAIYGAAPPSRRIAAHRALAATLDGERSTWHRAAATTGPDEDLATALDDAAAKAFDRGDLSGHMRLLERAADFTADPAVAGRRLANACYSAQRAGLTDAALRLAARTARTTDDPLALTTVAVARDALARTAVPVNPDPLYFLETSGRVRPADVLEAASMVWMASTWFVAAGAHRTDTAAAIEQAAEQLGLPEDTLRLAAIRANIDPARFRASSRPVLRGALAYRTRLPVQHCIGVGMAAQPLHDWETSLSCYLTALETQQRHGAVVDIASCLSTLGRLQVIRGLLAEGLADAERGHRLATDLGQPVMVAYSAGVIAHVHAWYGDAAAAGAALADARRLSPPEREDMRMLQEWSAGVLALGEGRDFDAYVSLSSAVDAHRDFGLLAIADLVEAACRVGAADRVIARVDRAEQHSDALDAPLLRHLVNRARALLGDDPEQRFRAALADDGYPLQTARTRLAYGEWLRRRRRTGPARDELAAAAAVFDRVGARPWARRARTELRACGVPVPAEAPAAAAAAARLTAQELQIAELAAKGLSNKEIADHLFLSHRTVGSHLYRIYPKLGISGRGGLRDALEGRT